MLLKDKYDLQQFLFVDMRTIATELREDDDSKYYYKPAYSEVGAITVGYQNKEGSFRTKAFLREEHESEQGLIESFFRFIVSTKDKKIIASYSPSFLLPYLRTKALKYSIYYPWNDCGLKPWEIGLEKGAKLRMLDVSAYHRGISPYPISFEDFLISLGVSDGMTLNQATYDNLGKSVGDWELAKEVSLSSIEALFKATQKYFVPLEFNSESPKGKATSGEVPVNLSLSDRGKKDFTSLTIQMVQPILESRGDSLVVSRYRVQLSDNSDYVIEVPGSGQAPTVGQSASKYLGNE